MKENNKRIILVALCLMVIVSAALIFTKNDKLAIENEQWRIAYQKEDKHFNIEHKLDGCDYFKRIVYASVPEASYRLENGEERRLNSQQFKSLRYKTISTKDNFGKGRIHRFIFSKAENGDGVRMIQEFRLYEGQDFILTRLSIATKGKNILSSNYLAPIKCESQYELFNANVNNRMLKVPFDNDSFVRYHKFRLNRDMTSYEVAALFEGDSRRGIVLGSVEHNRWKSAISVDAEEDSRIKRLLVYSGASNHETRDVRPHGAPEGKEVASALFFIGDFADWRDGMECFAQANTKIQPARQTWTKGTPFGWQSWGVMADKNCFEVDKDVSDYFAQTLRPGGFVNDQGLNIISIDAWDNMSHEQKKVLTKICTDNGQIAGTYLSPFCLWWNEDMLHTHKVTEGSQYTGYDCVIKVNGQPMKLDGAYCLDPTHPGSKQMMSNDLKRIKAEGFKYVKVDFTSNGMVQADEYYNKNVKTAVEAYNEGFSHFIAEADKGEALFVALSIAPIFPYQYGNSRRIACDTWGKIGHSEYSMNAVACGWWTNQFYQYNDPDHLVLVGNDQVKESEAENRARITNGACSGMMLVSDNYSATHRPERGNAALSFERAKKILMNKDVNEMANIGKSFRPVFGYKEYNGQAEGAESCVMLQTEDHLYVAIINYREETMTESIPYERLGISQSDYKSVKELWSGEVQKPAPDALCFEVPGHDAHIYRFDK